MFVLPLSDANALVVTRKKATWRYHDVTFDPLRVTLTFKTPRARPIHAATDNPHTKDLWVLGHGRLYLFDARQRDIFRVPLPEDVPLANDIHRVGTRFFLACRDGIVRYYDAASAEEAWVPIVDAPPPPGRQPYEPNESTEAYVERTAALRRRHRDAHPDFHKIVEASDATYVLGGGGRVVRIRGDVVDELRLDADLRLLDGADEGDALVLCADNPRGVILRGTFEGGFEPLFEDARFALHKTALHQGQRFIGASADRPHAFPGSYAPIDGPSLFTWDGAQLQPMHTGCAREPRGLVLLRSTGRILWAVDDDGIFRMAEDRWTLTEFRDVRMLRPHISAG